MSLERARKKVVSVFAQRCVYLFAALLVLLVTVPFLEDSERGLIALNAINIIILFAAAVAVSDSRVCFAFAVVLGGSAIACQAAGILLHQPDLRVLGLGFGAAFYFMALSYLLAYVLRKDVLTVDKLYGAAAAYLMIGILWVYFYTILLRFHPGALAAGGAPVTQPLLSEIVYFSFTTLTSTGFGDVVPVHPISRMLCVLEQILGVLYIAILIARLAGSYTPADRRK